MRQPLHPETIELLACFAEKAGLLAATVIRERPEEARALAFGLFETVMLSFSHAVDKGNDQLRDSRAYFFLPVEPFFLLREKRNRSIGRTRADP